MVGLEMVIELGTVVVVLEMVIELGVVVVMLEMVVELGWRRLWSCWRWW